MLLPSSGRAQAIAPVLDPNVRSRPIISGGTVRTDTGQIIRAGRIQHTVAAAQQQLVWQRCRALGLNAMRVGFKVGSNTLSSVAAILDNIIAAAKGNRCYVILCNSEFAPGTYDDAITANEAILKTNWAYFGNRYKDEAHVILEMVNEPDGAPFGLWSHYANTNGSPTALATSLRRVFDLMRSTAPDSLILFPSFGNLNAPGGAVQFLSAIQAVTAGGAIDWTKTAISFHWYTFAAKLQVNSSVGGNDVSVIAADYGKSGIKHLMGYYPMINTECNWWVKFADTFLPDVTDAAEQIECAWSMLCYPQQPQSSSYSGLPLYPNFLDNKVAQLRSRGFSIPVE